MQREEDSRVFSQTTLAVAQEKSFWDLLRLLAKENVKLQKYALYTARANKVQ